MPRFQDLKPPTTPLMTPKSVAGPYPFPLFPKPVPQKAAQPTCATSTPHPRQEPPRLQGATDPRWVLAVRVAESLQGSVLPPDKRDRLIRVGKMLGLSAFDANLIVAMIQDQARRGLRALECAQAAQPQLCLIPLPSPRSHGSLSYGRILSIASLTIVAEAFLFWWLWNSLFR